MILRRMQEKNISANNYKKVFIVHGHDAELKEATARLIERPRN